MSKNIKIMRDSVRRELMDLVPDSTALIVIDMQEYQVRDGSITKVYGLMSPDISEYYLGRVNDLVEPNIIRLLNKFRSAGAMVCFTKYASTKRDESDLQKFIRDANAFSKEICGEPIIPHIDSPSASFVSGLKPRKNELVIQKSRSGSFTNTDLDTVLQENEIENLVIVGVLTHACVENTARLAVDLGYSVTVVDNACATLDGELHNNSIAAMEIINVNISQAADIRFVEGTSITK